MNLYPKPVSDVISFLSKFPGLGLKTAEKLTFYLLEKSHGNVEGLIDALRRLKSDIGLCSNCFHLTEQEQCSICLDTHRDHGVICVVETFKDLISVERASEYRGIYHVLMGRISPIEGVNPEDLTIQALYQRIDKVCSSNPIREIILACNPNPEGNMTAMYLTEFLKRRGLMVSRIACGIPIGSALEFADPITLWGSFERRERL